MTLTRNGRERHAMKPMLAVVMVLLGGIAGRGTAQTESLECPPGPDRVDASVHVDVTFDDASGKYTYAYTLSNSSTSPQELERFVVDADLPLNILAPTGWLGIVPFDGAFEGRSVSWMAVDLDPADLLRDTGAGIPGSPSNVKPGESRPGFSVQSLNPPGAVNYELYGRATVTFEAATGDEWEAILEDLDGCAATGNVGVTTGPVASRSGRPAAPGAPAVTLVTPQSAILKWTESPRGAASYELERAPDVRNAPGKWYPVARGVQGVSFVDSTLVPDTAYWYRVRGLSSVGGVGPWSAGVMAESMFAAPDGNTSRACRVLRQQ